MISPLPRLLILALMTAAALPGHAADVKPAPPAVGLNDLEKAIASSIYTTQGVEGADWKAGKLCDATFAHDEAQKNACWRVILARFARTYADNPPAGYEAALTAKVEAVVKKKVDPQSLKTVMRNYANSQAAPTAAAPNASKLPTDVKAITQANECAKSAEECAKVIQGSKDTPTVAAGKLPVGATDTGKTASSEVVDPNAAKGKNSKVPTIGALTANPKKAEDPNAANDTIAGVKGAIYGGLLGLMFGGPIGFILFAAIGFGATYMISKKVNS